MTCRSQTACALRLLAGAVVSWSSGRQRPVAVCAVESEYQAAAAAAATNEALRLRKVPAHDLGVGVGGGAITLLSE